MKINRTVDRAVNMLEILSNYTDGLTLNELCEMMDIPKSSCFDILHTLVNSNMVEQFGREGKVYRIGVKSFIIGNQYMENKQLIDIARNRIEKLGDRFGKTVFLAEDSLEHAVYVYKYQPKISTLIASCKVGAKNEYYNTALGKCILSFREDHLDQIDNFFDNGLISDKDKFTNDIIDIRKNKYACSNQEHQKQLFCISCPVFDHNGMVSLAISMSGLYSGEAICQKETEDLKEVAKNISRELGYVGIY